ncbi:hypothetical protein BN381_70065 [Candidatus Microthrix parvicella RN1]|uniref:Uncharacterized protein n=1 Tax=Candidatus Neomicrothrix parvicella RN1 TaxID=1229780 RepID=R4Z6J5_9ACTN|nr:hypothetical protein BN381_70065 [Candidatus Microthrix parvicella RN1]
MSRHRAILNLQNRSHRPWCLRQRNRLPQSSRLSTQLVTTSAPTAGSSRLGGNVCCFRKVRCGRSGWRWGIRGCGIGLHGIALYGFARLGDWIPHINH